MDEDNTLEGVDVKNEMDLMDGLFIEDQKKYIKGYDVLDWIFKPYIVSGYRQWKLNFRHIKIKGGQMH